MSLSLIEELELQVIALSGNDRAHCAGLVQQDIDALKAQPGGVVLPPHVNTGAAIQGVLQAIGIDGDVSYHLAGQVWNACLDEVARLNSSPGSAGVKLPDDFVCDSKPLQDLLNATAMLLETPCPGSATYWAAMLANVEALLNPISAGGVDERAAFEAAWAKHYKVTLPEFHPSKHRAGESYNPEYSPFIGTAWWAWRQARAASAPSHGEQVREWIHVSERLPEVGQHCLIKIPVCGRHEIEGAEYKGDGDWRAAWCTSKGRNCTYKVSHWMAAPSAGQKEQGE